MNINSVSRKTYNPPVGKPTAGLLSEEAYTDPEPDIDEPVDARYWYHADDLYDMISEVAYYKAEQRGFEFGHENLDWLEAEQELLDQLEQEPVY